MQDANQAAEPVWRGFRRVRRAPAIRVRGTGYTPCGLFPHLNYHAAMYRESYLTFDELSALLRRWADENPELVRLSSIGTSRLGRELWMLTIGPDPDRVRPAVWVDGNMHAQELCGSSVALAIAADVIAMHRDPGSAPHGLTPAMAAAVRGVLFHIVPRMSPDGAEEVLASGRPLRSVPRLSRRNLQHPRWVSGDVDGDGRIRLMRVADPGGELVGHPDIPGLLLPRLPSDDGPFYKVYVEGTIENFDGYNVPSPAFLDDNDTDFNRNFPYAWAPPEKQTGAGAFPLSEPETRAIVETTSAMPHLFAWLNLHTFGGVFIRPLGDKPDTKMDPEDLALYRQLGDWATELTGYPMVSGFEEFTYEPDTPIYGDLTEYAFHQRGCIAYVVELWDLFARVGLERKQRFVDSYSHLTRADMIAIAEWDRDHNRGRVFGAWRPFEHPQLGAVEIGGVDPRAGVWNPPPEHLGEVCRQHSAHFLRLASLAPSISVRELDRRRDGDLTRLAIAVENRGYLPTHILSSARSLELSEPLSLDLTCGGAATLASESRHAIGHLDGWGRGQFGGEATPYYQRTRGTTHRRVIQIAVTGSGTVTARAGSCRVGHVSATFEI